MQNPTTSVRFLEDGSIQAGEKTWRFDPLREPYLLTDRGQRIPFSSFQRISAAPVHTGLGVALRTVYQGLEGFPDCLFETEALISATDGHVDFTLTAVREGGLRLKEAAWPAPLAADEAGSYAVLNTM